MINLKTGTKVVLTKISVKDGESSAFKVGQKRSGTLSSDIDCGHAVHFEEWNGCHVTSAVESLEPDGESFILKTRTSVYSLRVVGDENDTEFKEWLRF